MRALLTADRNQQYLRLQMTDEPRAYSVAKHGVVRLTEGVYTSLRERKARIGATVLCPGVVATGLTAMLAGRERLHRFVNHWLTPAEVREKLQRADKFYDLAQEAGEAFTMLATLASATN